MTTIFAVIAALPTFPNISPVSGYGKTTRIENPTRCHSVSTFYFILIWSSTCFGRHTAIIRSLKLHYQSLVLHKWRVVGHVVAERCQEEWSVGHSIRVILQGVSKWLEQFQSAITAIKTHAEVSFPTWNKTASVLVLCACAIPCPSSLSVCDVTKR
jgi:hypothetical protein